MSSSESKKAPKRVRGEDAEVAPEAEVPVPKRAAPAPITLVVHGGVDRVEVFPDRVVAHRAERVTRSGATISVDGPGGTVIRGRGSVAHVVGNGNIVNATGASVIWTGGSGATYSVGPNAIMHADLVDIRGDTVIIHRRSTPPASGGAAPAAPSPAAETTERLRAGEQLAAVEVHGSAAVTIHAGVTARNLRLTLHGAAAVNLHEARLDTLRLATHGASVVSGHGVRADRVYAGVHGAGTVSGVHADVLFSCTVAGVGTIRGTVSPSAGVDKTIAGMGTVSLQRAAPQ